MSERMSEPRDEPYLIAHLVRGEPAFDIAIKMDVPTDDEPWWIIPTSGHRAYPWWSMELKRLGREGWGVYYEDDLWKAVPPCPEGTPDHYTATPAPRGQGLIRDLASILNLIPRPTIRRR